MTTTRNPLTLPLYANKPQRRIPGTRATAVTMYRSGDGTVAEYAILTDDAHLGTAHLQVARRFRSRGYTLESCPRISAESWPTLTAFALEMGRRNGLDVSA